VEGKRVCLEYDQNKRDDYHRSLAYVGKDGVLVNGELVKNGLALVDVRYPNLMHHQMFFDCRRKRVIFTAGYGEKLKNILFLIRRLLN
jgi:endonuclease YncB( thermonuclease family)